MRTDKGYRTQWHPGYEPGPKTFSIGMLRKTLESNQIPEGTSRLAGGPYLHQGLSSVVFTTGYDPITSCVSDKCSTDWATWTIKYFSRGEPIFHFLLDSCSLLTMVHTVTTREPNIVSFGGQGRGRSYNLSVNSRLLYQLSYLSFFWWERRDSNPQGLTTTDLQSAEPTNCSTLPFVHSTGIEPVTCCM